MTSVTLTSVDLLVEGAMNAMFLAKLKFTVLVCGLIAIGTLVVVPHAGALLTEAQTQAAGAGDSAYRSPAASTPGDDDAAVRARAGPA